MAGLSSRWIIVLCLALLSQQFAPVYMAHLSKNALVKHKRSEDEEAQEQSQGDDEEQGNAEERWKVGKLIKWAWKGLRKTVNKAEKLADVASLSTTVLQAIGGCGVFGFKIKQEWEKYTKLVDDYKRISDQIDAQILQAYNMRDSANYSYLIHYDVRQEMERLVTEQNYAFEAMDPRFKHVINNETHNLEQMIKQKKANGEEVSLLEVDCGYKKGLELALELAWPTLSLAMPYGKKLFKHLKKGVIGRKMDTLQEKFNMKFSIGSASDDTRKLLEGYESLGTKADSKKLTSKISKMFSNMKKKYAKVEKIVKGIKSGFKTLMSIGSLALNVWTTFQQIRECADKYTNAIKSVQDMTRFVEGNKELLKNATETVENTKKAMEDIYNVAWDKNLLKGLGMIKDMVADEAISKPRPEATEIIGSIDLYMAGSLDAPDELFTLQDNLRKNLRLVTYNTGCFTIKGKFVSNVNEVCAEGTNTYEQGYEDFVGTYEYPEKIDDCRESSGELYITLDKMKQAWEAYAEGNNSIHKICLLNNPEKVKVIQDAVVDREKDLSKIATSLFLQNSKGINEELQAAMKEFPNVDDLPLSKALKARICFALDWDPEMETDKIIKSLEKRTDKNITAKEVEEAKKECPKKK